MTALPNIDQFNGNVTQGGYKAANAQLITYLQETTSASTGKILLTTSGTFTVPNGVTQLFATATAGGGGGSSVYGCGGGGGQSIKRFPITVTPGQIISYIIGTGGVGSKNDHPNGTTDYTTVGNVSGSDGTVTSFGSYFSLAGGKGATAIINGSSINYHGGKAGGLNATDGENVVTSIMTGTTYSYNGGKGGSSLLGIGGTGGHYSLISFDSTVGNDGAGNGSGGGGGSLYQSGSTGAWTRAGSGSDGIIILEW